MTRASGHKPASEGLGKPVENQPEWNDRVIPMGVHVVDRLKLRKVRFQVLEGYDARVQDLQVIDVGSGKNRVKVLKIK